MLVTQCLCSKVSCDGVFRCVRVNIVLFITGQGANQALEDGPRLVEWLLKEGDKDQQLFDFNIYVQRIFIIADGREEVFFALCTHASSSF